MHDIDNTFDRETLRRVCTMDEREFGFAYDLTRVKIDQPVPDDYYFFRDYGSKILAVAHLDTVGQPHERDAHFIETEGGTVVYSRALDDRLGAYIILELLPALGIQHDILLTVGEESGNSTAAGFVHPTGKQYDWIIEFDRGGTDVVMYEYDDDATRAAVKAAGARVGDGIFSDICYLEHLGAKGFNWGVGYRDYHGPRAHAYLDDTFMMLEFYIDFWIENDGVAMPHEPTGRGRGVSFDWWMEDEDFRALDPIDYAEPGDDWLDEDFIEYPTSEQLRAFEDRLNASELTASLERRRGYMWDDA